MQDVSQYKYQKNSPTFKFATFYAVEKPLPLPSAWLLMQCLKSCPKWEAGLIFLQSKLLLAERKWSLCITIELKVRRLFSLLWQVDLNHNCLLSTAHTTGRSGREVAQSQYQVTSVSVFEIIFLPLQLCFLYGFNELNCQGKKERNKEC